MSVVTVDRTQLNTLLTPIWASEGLEGEEYDEALNELTHMVADFIETTRAGENPFDDDPSDLGFDPYAGDYLDDEPVDPYDY